MTIGTRTCCVCGRDFPLYSGSRYTVRDKEPPAIIAAFGDFEPKSYDAFNCVHCGCQNLVNRRLAACEEEEDNTCPDTE